MPDRVRIVARIGADKLQELLKAISAGGEPPPSEAEWASLRDYWQGKLPRRTRGHHVSTTRHAQAMKRLQLRDMLEGLRLQLYRDPSERAHKRDMRREGLRYDVNEEIVQRLRARLLADGDNDVPTASYLKNILSRSWSTLTKCLPDQEWFER